MTIAFERASGWHLFRRLVARLTGGPYCHVELRFSNGEWFSSAPSYHGTTFHPEPDQWNFDWLTIATTPDQEDAIRRFCEDENHCPYDWFGAAACALKFLHPSESRWYSSIVARRFTNAMPSTRSRG